MIEIQQLLYTSREDKAIGFPPSVTLAQRLAAPAAQPPLEPQGGLDSPPGMSLVSYWHPEQRHKANTEKLLDGALIAVSGCLSKRGGQL